MISTKYTIREQNESKILNAIIINKEISRASLSNDIGLTKASVSSITKKLIEDDLIYETRVGSSSVQGGRKPIMLTFNGKSALAISFDVGKHYIEGMLSYIDGSTIEIKSNKSVLISKDNVLSELKQLIDYFINVQPKTPHGIVGVTIGIHGVVFDNEIKFTPYYDLDQSNVFNMISEEYDMPFFIYNEANLAALGDYTFTSNAQSLISLSIHTGIGAGIVSEGKLRIGEKGEAGEIGHSILFPGGTKCPCGNHGCIEQYASNSVFYQEFSERKSIKKVNNSLVRQFFLNNDPETLGLIHKNAEMISIAVNNTIMLYDPEEVVINSTLYLEIPEMIDLVKSKMNSRFIRDVAIRNTLLGNHTTLFGGIAVCAQQFLNIQELKFPAL